MDKNKDLRAAKIHHSEPYYSDPEFDAVKKALPEYLEGLRKLEIEALDHYKGADADYEDQDLRKTVFGKYWQFIFNQIVIVRLAIEHEDILKRIITEEAGGIKGNFLTNFVRFPMRSMRDESIELVEHLMASILEAKGLKNRYVPFSKMLTDPFIEAILSEKDEKNIIFLKKWANERNTRHRNGEDHYQKNDGKKATLVKLDFDLKRFDRLLKILQEITSHPEVGAIPPSEKENDPLYDLLWKVKTKP